MNQYSAVDEYIANVVDFARAYLFKVYLTFPIGLGTNTEVMSCFAKSTTLPDVTTEEVISYYMGMQNRMSSVRRYSDWQIVMNMDKNGDLYKNLYDWNRLCHSVDNIYGMPKEYIVGYPQNPGRQVIQLLGSQENSDRELENKPVLTYYLNYAWPKSISNVALDYESNQFITMDVTFSFQSYEVL